MIEVSNVRLPLDAGLPGNESLVEHAVAQALGLASHDIDQVEMLRRSVDARKGETRFIATLAVALHDPAKEDELVALAETPAAKSGRGKGADRSRRSKSKRGKGRPASEDRSAGASVAKGVTVKRHVPYQPLEVPPTRVSEGLARPVVVGTGPAGLFAALYLARAGLRPLVIERGGDVDERTRAVDAFNRGDNLDVSTNVQFGEGGAGTFSDGKLTTGTKSPLARHVLQWFVDAGAPEEILWQAKPHIGTDKLIGVVKRIRGLIEEHGGQVLFHAKLQDVLFDESGTLKEVAVACEGDSLDQLTELLAECSPNEPSGRDGHGASAQTTPGQGDNGRAHGKRGSVVNFPCTTLILACGHSARDTFRMLQRAHLAMEPKPFSVGVRIEHRQSDIDRAQYGKSAGHPALGAADYKLVVHLPGGRSVYTFCMCPGGEVVAAASEEYGVVVNGMSVFARDGSNANAALLVGVTPDDFKSADPLAGTVFQRRIEQAAFGEAHEMGGDAWQAPAQTVGDFLADKAGNPSKSIKPTYARGVVWCDLREILPEFVTDAMAEAIPLLDRKLRGFADPDAVMTGVETRSSSPVRILRDEVTLQAWRQEPPKRKVRARDIARGHGRPAEAEQPRVPCGIFPAGEGPGYAGGIMSAAVDGLRIARKVAQRYAIAEAAEALRRGEPATFPTDTVYGLGVSVKHAASPQVLYEMKQRDQDKPIAWLVGGPESLDEFGCDVPEAARELVREYWPGALTVVVKASDAVPDAFRSKQGTIGLRMPDNDAALALIREVASPIATTSANLSGDSNPVSAEELPRVLTERAAVVAGDCGARDGVASTVVECVDGTLRVLRQGSIDLS